jgi:tetratricopeptide (TPR) repeat protein
MQRTFLIAAILSVNVAATAAESSSTTDPDAIGKLIEQLGSDKYALRRRAEEELSRLGPTAHDQLKRAEQHNDLEIAERASYILQSMRVDWLRPHDSPEVRRALFRFGDLSRDEKLSRIQMLAALPDGQGLPALCRVARLEHLPTVARRAALVVVKSKLPDETVGQLSDACREELQAAERPATAWIELWLRERSDRRGVLPEWDKAIAAEMKLHEEESNETDSATVFALLQRRLDVCNELGLTAETSAALTATVDFLNRSGDADELADDADQDKKSLAWAIAWLVERERWDLLPPFYDAYQSKIHADRQLLYRYAAALSRGGREDEANKLADRALAMKAGEPIERISVADVLSGLGSVDWALREYRAALEEAPPLGYEALHVRQRISSWLHDREDFKGASDALAEFFKEFHAKENRAAKRELLQQFDGLRYLNDLEARQLLFLANHHHARGDFDQERETLEQAFEKSKDDPDILIAMYRLPEASEEYKKQTRDRIAEMGDRYLNEIEASPEDPSKYNQWAWLVSNTEGDFKKAVEYSRRSLELSPDEPSYLDTLGRCYFAAGDVESAIEAQKKAVKLAPQYQIMRRQLAEFEKAKK